MDAAVAAGAFAADAAAAAAVVVAVAVVAVVAVAARGGIIPCVVGLRVLSSPPSATGRTPTLMGLGVKVGVGVTVDDTVL